MKRLATTLNTVSDCTRLSDEHTKCQDYIDFANCVAQTVISCWEKLPKSGKPVLRGNKVEWTVLAGIVAVWDDDKVNNGKLNRSSIAL
jgi:hypothetical protein